MGSAKEEWMRQQELEPMYDWIEENYGDDAGEEGSEQWDETVQAYRDYCEKLRRQEEEEIFLYDLACYIHSESQIGRFDTQINNVYELLEVKVSREAQFSLFVMLHSHIVAAVEFYLASLI